MVGVSVIQKRAGEMLLDSYEAERRAVAVANTELSVSNWKEALKVPQALGLDPAAANVLHSVVTSRPASMLSSGGCPKLALLLWDNSDNHIRSG